MKKMEKNRKKIFKSIMKMSTNQSLIMDKGEKVSNSK